MRGWLLKQALDAVPALTANEARRLSVRVQRLASFERWATLLTMLPGYLPILAIPVLARSKSWALPWQIAVALVVAALGLLFSLWLRRRAYIRHARRAVRELGFADICPSCGYDLAHVAASTERCPECGLRIVLMPRLGCEAGSRPPEG